eukprot:9302916-Pyramimonas_sp.AAC.1
MVVVVAAESRPTIRRTIRRSRFPEKPHAAAASPCAAAGLAAAPPAAHRAKGGPLARAAPSC